MHEWQRFDDTIAMLLERCTPGTALSTRPETEQDDIVAGLLPRLWRTPAPGAVFRPLSDLCRGWADEADARSEHAVLDARLVHEGLTLFRTLPDTADRQVLLCTDMHAGNVLASRREPWLVIDPKPYVGDPTFDALQHMLNCMERLHADPIGFAARIAGLLDLDRDRLLHWLFARCVQQSASWPALADVARRIAPT